VPILLGEGLPLFPSGFLQRNFPLVENKTFSQGLIALKYLRNQTHLSPKSRPSANRKSKT